VAEFLRDRTGWNLYWSTPDVVGGPFYLAEREWAQPRLNSLFVGGGEWPGVVIVRPPPVGGYWSDEWEGWARARGGYLVYGDPEMTARVLELLGEIHRR
jgi:hypothetical protein